MNRAPAALRQVSSRRTLTNGEKTRADGKEVVAADYHRSARPIIRKVHTLLDQDGMSNPRTLSLVTATLTVLVCRTMSAGWLDVEDVDDLFLWGRLRRTRLSCAPVSQADAGKVHLHAKCAGFLYKQLQEVEKQYGEDADITYLKFWQDLYLWKVNRSVKEPPVNRYPLVRSPFTGYWRKVMRRLSLRQDFKFAVSLQRGSKFAWRNLGTSSHLKALKTAVSELEGFRGDITPEMAKSIDEASSHVYKTSSTKPVVYTKYSPNTRAVYEKTQKQGGSLGLVASGPLPLPNTPEAFEEKLLGKARYQIHQLNRWVTKEFQADVLEAYRLSDLVDERGNIASCAVRLIAIPEPGKFRSLTISTKNMKNALLPLQGAMLSAWKKTSFSTMEDEDLTGRVQTLEDEVGRVFPEWKWNSGDYQSATNLLKRSASLRVLQNIRNRYPGVGLAEVSILPGTAYYVDPETKKKVFFTLSEGQLMGHVLSFSMLCTINLACYWSAVDRYLADNPDMLPYRGLLRRSVIINGDDILFKADDQLYQHWVTATEEAGFKLSVGKNYFCDRFCMINSQYFSTDAHIVTRVYYLNQHLSFPREVDLSTPVSAARELGKICKSVPWARMWIPIVMSRYSDTEFKCVHRGKTVNFQPNWFLPVHLGGYGLSPALSARKIDVTHEQLKMAQSFLDNPELALYRTQPALKVSSPLTGLKSRYVLCRGKSPAESALDLLTIRSLCEGLSGPLAPSEWSIEDFTERPPASSSGGFGSIDNIWTSACYAGQIMADPERQLPGPSVVKAKLKMCQWGKAMSRQGIIKHWWDYWVEMDVVPAPSLPTLRYPETCRYVPDSIFTLPGLSEETVDLLAKIGYGYDTNHPIDIGSGLRLAHAPVFSAGFEPTFGNRNCLEAMVAWDCEVVNANVPVPDIWEQERDAYDASW